MFGNEINVAELDQPDKSQGIYDLVWKMQKKYGIHCCTMVLINQPHLMKVHGNHIGEEVKSYYDESDKINKEHNYYDYEIGQVQKFYLHVRMVQLKKLTYRYKKGNA